MRPDEVAQEEPLEIRVRGRAISVTMRTPGHDHELAAGFLLTEGIIQSGGDILRVEHCHRNDFGNVLNVLLAPEVMVDFERLTRHVFASSSCGICGKATIESVMSQFAPIRSDLVLDADLFAEMPDRMRAAQATFDRTGGLHAAALFDANGKLIVLREDVGRHNAVDKVIGHCLLHGAVDGRQVLLVSGRSSFEIVQKAVAARIPVVAAISAHFEPGCELCPRKRDDADRIPARAEDECLRPPQSRSVFTSGQSGMSGGNPNIDLARNTTLVVLAGGEGKRMGFAKSHLVLDGTPVLLRLLDQLAWPGPTLLVTARGREHPPGWKRFDRELTDCVDGEGPLRAIQTARAAH